MLSGMTAIQLTLVGGRQDVTSPRKQVKRPQMGDNTEELQGPFEIFVPSGDDRYNR